MKITLKELKTLIKEAVNESKKHREYYELLKLELRGELTPEQQMRIAQLRIDDLDELFGDKRSEAETLRQNYPELFGDPDRRD